MTDEEILDAFPAITAEDIHELRSGAVDAIQASDTDGTVCLLRLGFNDEVIATDNF